MFTDKYLHDFLKDLSKNTGDQSFVATNYGAEDLYLLRSHLRAPLEFNPSETNNIQIETLVILVHSLINQRNEDGSYLASCYTKAKQLLDKVSPPSSKNDSSAFLGYPNGDLLYEISRFLESPINVVAARIYGIHPESSPIMIKCCKMEQCAEAA